MIFGIKVIEHKLCLDFVYKFVLNISIFLRTKN